MCVRFTHWKHKIFASDIYPKMFLNVWEDPKAKQKATVERRKETIMIYDIWQKLQSNDSLFWKWEKLCKSCLDYQFLFFFAYSWVFSVFVIRYDLCVSRKSIFYFDIRHTDTVFFVLNIFYLVWVQTHVCMNFWLKWKYF